MEEEVEMKLCDALGGEPGIDDDVGDFSATKDATAPPGNPEAAEVAGVDVGFGGCATKYTAQPFFAKSETSRVRFVVSAVRGLETHTFPEPLGGSILLQKGHHTLVSREYEWRPICNDKNSQRDRFNDKKSKNCESDMGLGRTELHI